jgi:photosystem II stability/assembly factor-like uncharacterized protein
MAILNLVFSAASPKVVWAGGEKGILWRSGDAGASFEAAGKPGKDPIRAILPDPRRPELLLVVTEGGAFGSATSGESWQKVLDGKVALARHPRQPDALLAALSDGTIQASADGGRTWRKGGSFEGKPLGLSFDRRGGRVYLMTDTQLLRSEDDGKTFEKQPKFVSGVVQDPLRERRWYAVESARPRLDDGAGFARFDRSLDDAPNSDGDVLIAGSDFLTFVSRKGVFFRTFCGTDDWSPIERRSELGPGADVKTVAVDPKNWKRWLASDSAGIWLTDDVAKTWTKVAEAR